MSITQLYVLTKKNFLLSLRGWKATVVQIFNPLAFLLILFLLQKLYEGTQTGEPTQLSINSNLPRCIVGPNNDKCFTLLYAPRNPASDDLIAHIASNNDPPLTVGPLTLTSDSTQLIVNDTTGLPDIGVLQSQEELEQFVLANPNITQNAIFFQFDTMVYYLYNNITSPLDVEYTTSLMLALDEAIASVKHNTTLKVTGTISGFPRSTASVASQDAVMKGTGPVWLYCPSMFNFILFTYQIVVEKERRTRMAMYMVGLRSLWYWLSWLISFSFIALLNTLVLMACGYAFQFTIFTNADFSVNFVTYFVFALSTIPLAFLVSTFTSNSSTASTICFLIFVLGFFIQIIFAGFSVYIWYKPTISEAIHLVFETIYAPFNFAKLFADINTLTSPASTTTYTHHYYWSDMFRKLQVQPFKGDEIFSVQPTIDSIYFLLVNFGIYLLVAIYLDLVIPAAHAIPKPFYFLFLPSFWKQMFCAPHSDPPTAIGSESSLQSQGQVAISVENLVKVYRRFPCCSTKGDARAVDNLNFQVENGKLLCILGKNGAGKTSTLSILSGLLPADGGDAFIFGLSVRTQMQRIRRLIGICPQFDILYDDLTAEEHLELFANIKGISQKEIKEQISDLLKSVNLDKAAHNRVSTFSGGMRRRLSVAISMIGNPKVVFLDEPTTGMDPISRNEVWRVIERMKKNRVIVLTTHLLNEADILSDVIGIMSAGKMRCFGTSLELKNQFGSGYYVSIVCPNSKKEMDLVKNTFVSKIKSARLTTATNGNLVFNVHHDDISKVRRVLRDLGQKGALRDWGISHTTLEEVFLQVTGDNVIQED